MWSMSPLSRVVLVVVLILVTIMALGGCAAPRHATLVLKCNGKDCTISDGKPEYHVDPDDANACEGSRRRPCTEL